MIVQYLYRRGKRKGLMSLRGDELNENIRDEEKVDIDDLELDNEEMEIDVVGLGLVEVANDEDGSGT